MSETPGDPAVRAERMSFSESKAASAAASERRRLTGEQEPGQPGVDRHGEQIMAQGRDPAVVQSTQAGQEPFGRLDGGLGRRLEPAKAPDVGLAPCLQSQHGRGQVGPLDLGGVEGRSASVLTLGPEPQAASRSQPAGSTGPLGGRRATDLAQFQAVEPTGRVVRGEPGQAAVDDGAHALDGQRGLGDVGREDDLAPIRRLQGPVLFVARQAPMQRQDEQILTDRDRFQPASGAADLLHARQKDKDVSAGNLGGFQGQGVLHGATHFLGQRRANRGRREIGDFHRKGPPLGPQRRATAQKRGDRPGIERCGHDHDTQILAHGGLHLSKQGQSQVGGKTAFVELVEDDRAHAFEERVGDELAGQNPLGDDPKPCFLAQNPLKPDLIADLLPDASSALLGDPRGRRSGRHAAGLEEHNRRVRTTQQPRRIEQGRRHPGRLARAGRGLQDQVPRRPQHAHDFRQQRVDRQRGK